MEDNLSSGAGKLEEAQYRIQGLQRAMATRRLDEPGSDSRRTFVEQFLSELHGIETDVLAVEESDGTSLAVTTALLAVAKDRSTLQQFAGEADPPGVRSDMTWSEAFRQADILAHAQVLKDEITKHVQPGQDDPVGTLFRSDGPQQGAQEFARQELAGQIEKLRAVADILADQIGTATMDHSYPGFDYKTGDPPRGFQSTVRGLIQQMAPVLFPLDAGYVTGELFNLLVSVYAHIEESIGGDIGDAAAQRTLVDLLFLRSQLPAVATYASGLSRGTVACEALIRSTAILMTAAAGTGPGKIPAGYHGELTAIRFYVDAFMKAMLNRLRAAAAYPPSPSQPTPP
jgi:hypothetical protein